MSALVQKILTKNSKSLAEEGTGAKKKNLASVWNRIDDDFSDVGEYLLELVTITTPDEDSEYVWLQPEFKVVDSNKAEPGETVTARLSKGNGQYSGKYFTRAVGAFLEGITGVTLKGMPPEEVNQITADALQEDAPILGMQVKLSVTWEKRKKWDREARKYFPALDEKGNQIYDKALTWSPVE